MSKSGLTPMFSERDLERWFDHFVDRAEEKIYTLLSAAGEKFVEVCRKSKSYNDQTGNLRSSIGYIIVIDGEVVSENFEQAKGGSQGIAKARQLAITLASTYPKGYVLIGVAGMNYAAAVEARGKDVISSGNIQCEEYLRKALKRVFKRI